MIEYDDPIDTLDQISVEFMRSTSSFKFAERNGLTDLFDQTN